MPIESEPTYTPESNQNINNDIAEDREQEENPSPHFHLENSLDQNNIPDIQITNVESQRPDQKTIEQFELLFDSLPEEEINILVATAVTEHHQATAELHRTSDQIQQEVQKNHGLIEQVKDFYQYYKGKKIDIEDKYSARSVKFIKGMKFVKDCYSFMRQDLLTQKGERRFARQALDASLPVYIINHINSFRKFLDHQKNQNSSENTSESVSLPDRHLYPEESEMTFRVSITPENINYWEELSRSIGFPEEAFLKYYNSASQHEKDRLDELIYLHTAEMFEEDEDESFYYKNPNEGALKEWMESVNYQEKI